MITIRCPWARFLVTLACLTVLMGAQAAHADNRLNNNGHWERRSSVAHVKFLDYTPSPWPVRTASGDWDQAYNIDVDWFLAGSTNCGPDCVEVRELPHDQDPVFLPDCTGAAAYWTNHPPNTQNHWQGGGYNEVRFNRSCNDAPADARRALTCQELGHALGLAHDVPDSCMHQEASEAAQTPRPHDYGWLNNVIYDHDS